MRIGFLGLGNMGTPMVKRPLAARNEVVVWNRSRERAREAEEHGARLVGSPAEVARECDVVLSMLFDDGAHEEVLFGPPEMPVNGLLSTLRPGALHISLSTISVKLSERLTQEHARRSQEFVAAPVFGRPNVAAEGRLWIAVAGNEDAVGRAKPLLEPLSRGITVVGKEPRQAHALKLGGNFLISTMIYSLGEAFVFADAQGIEPEVFFETVNSALFQSPFYAAYAKVMLNPPKQPGATMKLGEKDLSLLRAGAAAQGTSLSLAEDLADVFATAIREGLGDEDWAVGLYKMAKERSVPDANKA